MKFHTFVYLLKFLISECSCISQLYAFSLFCIITPAHFTARCLISMCSAFSCLWLRPDQTCALPVATSQSSGTSVSSLRTHRASAPSQCCFRNVQSACRFAWRHRTAAAHNGFCRTTRALFFCSRSRGSGAQSTSRFHHWQYMLHELAQWIIISNMPILSSI